jgi:hypothetical protein
VRAFRGQGHRSLIESAKLNDTNPQRYLADVSVLSRVADYPARHIA